MRILRYALMAAMASLLLTSCADKPKKAPEVSDGPSTENLSAADVKDAVPRAEPRARYGNHSPYEVFGKKYTVMDSSKGYRKKGTASWYGSKFQGHKTSNGEIYDLYLASAAHKTLPIPSFARVTNLCSIH